MTLNINTAKALLAVIKTSGTRAYGELDRVQVQTFRWSASPSGNRERGVRYLATNGHVLLCVEQKADNPASMTISLDDLKEYVASKGYSTLTDRSDDYGDFPNWQQCIPSGSKATETIGLAAKYLKMLTDIGRFLKVGDLWKATFAGDLEATRWEPTKLGDYSRVSFIIMPFRID